MSTMSLTSFFNVRVLQTKKVLRNLTIANHDLITFEGFSSLREQATKWASVNAICCSEPPNFETFYVTYIFSFMLPEITF